VKQERPAAAWPPLRWAAAALAATALVLGAGACSGGGDDAAAEPSDPLTAALSYLPASTGLVAVVPTGESSALRALERLGKDRKQGRLLRARLGAALTAAGVDPVALRAQAGNPLALGFGATARPLAALRLRDPPTLRRLVEERIDSKSAERLDAPDDVLAWRPRGGSGARGVAAIDRHQLVLADTEPDLDRALEAAQGDSNIAHEPRFVEELSRLGDREILRSVGDAQRLLSRDPLRAEALRRIRWVRALGLVTGTARVDGGKVRLDLELRTDRVPLTVGNLPLAPGTRSPPVHANGAAAAFAALDPDRLARFIERTVEVTNPEAYGRYASGIDQLSALFAVDVHYDIFRKLRSISVAFSSPAALRFVAPIEAGSEAQVVTSLRRAAPAIDYALPDYVPGAKLVPVGSPASEWELRRGKIVIARIAVKDGALIGSIGLGGLPRVSGHKVPGVDGSLVAVGDLRQLGRIVGLVFNLPAQALEPVLELGDVRLGVVSDTEALHGSGYLELNRHQ
jgi:hypothetical protein